MNRTIATLAVALTVSTQAVQAQVMHQHAGQDTSHMMGQGMTHQGMMGEGMMQGMMPMQMMRDMDMGMIMAGVPAPAMILGAAESLNLTDAQKTRLEALQKQFTETVQAHMQEAMVAQHRAAQTLGGDKPDVSAYESALKDAMNHLIMARVASARTSLDARAVLTADQRSKLMSLSNMMHGMIGGMMDGMMGQHRQMHGMSGMTGR
jgi:Spy/CpxP family protein refolding chaperone